MSSDDKEKEKKETCKHSDCDSIIISLGPRCGKKCPPPPTNGEKPPPTTTSPLVPLIVFAVLLVLSLIMTYGEQQSKPTYRHHYHWPYTH